MVATIFRAAEALGEPIRNHVGGYRFGGHSLRTGGAHLLASRGVAPVKIQVFGRWKSDLVARYAGEALASGMALDLRGSVSYTHLTLPTTSEV